ncbi:MAG: hypothetical protein J0M09_02230 [Xanthomonadales bacterium]|nr:hypothetical protein [Xanthomonadales bacterium]
MKSSLAELNALKDSWARLVEARPSEVDFSGFGYEGLNANIVSASLTALIEIVEAHVTKLKPTERDDLLLADAAATRDLRQLKSWVESARGNGISWLLTATTFLSEIASVNAIIRQVIGRNVDVRARIAKIAADRFHGDLTIVQDAAASAENVLNTGKFLQDSAKSIDAVKSNVDLAQQSIQSVLEKVDEFSEKLDKKKIEIDSFREEIESSGRAVAEARKIAEGDVSQLQGSVAGLNSAVDAALTKSKEALAELDQALLDARRQGLAKAFSDRHAAARKEYFVWVGSFILAIVLLAVLGALQFFAIKEGVDVVNSDLSASNAAIAMVSERINGEIYSSLRLLLAELPLAIPLVWLGWYSAKRIGAISRLVQDYEYKAATALAFESYKNEVELLGGSGEIAEQLLSTAIKTFGENPVRLTGVDDKNHAHPAESLLDSLKDEKIFERVKEIFDKFKA